MWSVETLLVWRELKELKLLIDDSELSLLILLILLLDEMELNDEDDELLLLESLLSLSYSLPAFSL